MESSMKLGRIWGIPVGLHLSWFLIFGLVTWSLASGYFPNEYPQLTVAAHWILGFVTSLFFFGSVLAHELGHAYLALRNQIPVKGITLFIFGGVAQIGQEPASSGVEFRVAIAGPLVSLGLGLLFGGAWLLDQRVSVLAAPSLYLMRINLLLAAFNMIPGFPLDGGRVLRALVWWVTKNFRLATRLATFIGQLVAFGFIAWGVFTIFRGDFFNGLWLAFIGWFLQNAAATTYEQMNMRESLRGVKVSQVMDRRCPRVPSLASINQVVEDWVLSSDHRCFFVEEDGKLGGLLTLRDITAVPQQKWRFTTTAQAMMPLSRLVQVEPKLELLSALQRMDTANVAQVPVIEDGNLVGMLSRDQIIHYLRTRAELGI